MKETYSKAVKNLKSKVKHSKEPLPKAVGLSKLRAEGKAAPFGKKHSKEALKEAAKHMKMHGG
jgi:hypothetical protein